MFRSRYTALLSVAMLFWPECLLAKNIPDAHFEVTVRQKENGMIAKGLHVADLFCWRGECSFTWLSLNQCGPAGSGGAAFYPKVERFSTQEGNLQVKPLGETLEVKLADPEWSATLRFGYRRITDASLLTSVASFSGGYVKNSVLLKKIIAVEYVPLTGRFNEVKLDCAALLPGVDTGN